MKYLILVLLLGCGHGGSDKPILQTEKDSIIVARPPFGSLSAFDKHGDTIVWADSPRPITSVFYKGSRRIFFDTVPVMLSGDFPSSWKETVEVVEGIDGYKTTTLKDGTVLYQLPGVNADSVVQLLKRESMDRYFNNVMDVMNRRHKKIKKVPLRGNSVSAIGHSSYISNELYFFWVGNNKADSPRPQHYKRIWVPAGSMTMDGGFHLRTDAAIYSTDLIHLDNVDINSLSGGKKWKEVYAEVSEKTPEGFYISKDSFVGDRFVSYVKVLKNVTVYSEKNKP